MEITASYTFAAPPEQVWSLLIDPAVVASCLPGCDELKPLGDDRYRAELTLAVASVAGRYAGTVAMLDKQPPRSYRLTVEGNGKPGFVNGEALIELIAEGSGTRVDVKGQAHVGGLIARVGQRLLTGASKMMMDRFFSCLQGRATGSGQDTLR
jgi:carbon monoxide dehydrogenase subunit G